MQLENILWIGLGIAFSVCLALLGAMKGFVSLGRSVERSAGRVADVLEPVGKGAGNVLDAIAGRIATKQADYDRLKAESLALAQEVARLEGRKINVTEMTAQLKLALIRVSQQYTSIARKTLELAEGTLLKQGFKTEYLGIVRADYQIQIGVDIDDLTFELMYDSILVHGLRKVQILGLSGLTIDPILAEVRKFSEDYAAFSGKAEIIQDDRRIHEQSVLQNKTILEEIQKHQSIEHLAEPNARFAKAFLQACFSGTGFKVEESIDPVVKPMTFGELCVELNRRVDGQVQNSNMKLIELDRQARQIESDILAIARGTDPDKLEMQKEAAQAG